MSGILYIIATPIGNLEDITLRAIRILREDTDTVYCEDTRQTRKLLNAYGIDLPAVSLHAHSSEEKLSRALAELSSGRSIAYLTDSGTPGVSDPGALLVSRARAEGIRVIPVPGPSALASIISVSGFSGRQVLFAGFLSKKDGRRKKELLRLKEWDGIIVLYESPHRIKKLLTAVREVFPGSDILVGRELTKIHEECLLLHPGQDQGDISSLKELGEFTLAINNRAD